MARLHEPSLHTGSNGHGLSIRHRLEQRKDSLDVQISVERLHRRFTVPFAPAILNWTAVDRRTDQVEVRARLDEADMLAKVPPSGILLALGDNDTYPLWYLQQVEGTRKDVTVVTVPLLAAEWYRAELARRYKLLDSATVKRWSGTDSTVAFLTRRSYDQNRPVIRSPFFSLDSKAAKK